jgi:DNA-binding transcriptional MerR regulator/uncharacterized protein (DUF433 family)
MTAKLSEPIRLGVGLYSVPEAARLAKLSAQRVRHWIDPQAGLIRGDLLPGERTLTFLDLMELHFVQMFREAGVSLETIRQAARTMARRFGCCHPFTVHRFDTDGRSIFSTMIQAERRKTLVEDLRHGQYVFENVIRPFFKKLEYQQDRAVRFWPMGSKQRVVLDPRRHFGKPIDAPTGVPTSALYHAIKAGDGQSTVATWFKVPDVAVAAAVKFEESLSA